MHSGSDKSRNNALVRKYVSWLTVVTNEKYAKNNYSGERKYVYSSREKNKCMKKVSVALAVTPSSKGTVCN